MILKRFCTVLLLSSVAVSAIAARTGNSPDDAVLAAYDAYRAGDAIKLARYAKQLDGHVLQPWLDYWRVALTLDDASAKDVHAYFAKHGNTYAGDLLRADWLRVLGRRGAWTDFDRDATTYPRDDLELRCYIWSSHVARGDESVLDEAAPVWLEPRELPEGCTRLVDTMWKRGRLSTTDVWRRVRVLFENGQITAAKTALGYMPKNERPDERALAEAARRPKRFLASLPATLELRPAREVAVLAGVRLAREAPDKAAAALEGPLGARLPERELKYLWGRVAIEGARLHNDRTLRWYANAGDTRLDDEQLAWRVRASLRRNRWGTVRDSIERMSPAAKQESPWIYWYGRALAAQDEEAGARAYYLRLAGQTDFYGLLAAEELGYVASLPTLTYDPSDEDVASAGREPGLARALELIRLGLRTEGVREWLFSLRGFDDRKLIAAAELARRAEVYDRAIQAADRTRRVHNYTLRYPAPYRDVFSEYAKSHGVDEALVLALVRQESRFVWEAKSAAGAAGLMQVMPHTARFVAGKMRMRDYRHKKVMEVETNITLGTGYLKLVLEQLGHPVLAAAAYNAGPTRARRWRADRALEGAIYAETIPFPETRDYVKKVMANSVFYGALLDKKVTPIKERLGTVPARAPGDVDDDDEDEEE
jgi:soluble lytic murein transglycosylase